jgi:DNA-binding HxlR family transcriptional regulator
MLITSLRVQNRRLALSAEVRTRGCHTYLEETMSKPTFTSADGIRASADIDALVLETISRVADKWTMLVLEVLASNGVLRFTELSERVGDVSQKMLTKTLRRMEQDGFVTRTVYPVVPPKVEYRLTELGESLGEAFCGVWLWAEKHQEELARRRASRPA